MLESIFLVLLCNAVRTTGITTVDLSPSLLDVFETESNFTHILFATDGYDDATEAALANFDHAPKPKSVAYFSVNEFDRIPERLVVPNDTLHVFMEFSEATVTFLSNLPLENFARDSSVILMVGRREISEIKREMRRFDNLDLASRLYAITSDAHSLMHIYEVFRIDSEIKTNELAVLNDTDMVWRHQPFIWERRKDLGGLNLNVAFKEDPPFIVEKVKNDNNFSTLPLSILLSFAPLFLTVFIFL